ncbi:putative mitochondrial protein [Tanacetum coccineum]
MVGPFRYALIVEPLIRSHGATVFSKIHLRSSYHQIRIRPEDEWKTTFKTRDELYEWMVMPFGLSNASRKHFHLHQVFLVLRELKLYSNGKKCHFLVHEVTFLGFVVSSNGIKMNDSKIEAIINWPTPTTIHDIRSFHGLASFYRHFIKSFSTIIAHVTECMKGGCFSWNDEVACDASGVGIGGVLSQSQRPIAFFIKKLSDARGKYSTYDKESYAIICSLDNWWHYLIPVEFVLFSDHELLKYIHGQHKIKPRHAKWAKFLQAFSFVIKHKDKS